ncbi:ATP-binding cassette domain-containing protein [Leucobacter sp. HNU]|uniref:ATP-binding cassette domain-containing protein n=1 Tax=Leucobacter sp. HNU TaxID=3236805 RepID=UPI003A80879F
MQRPRERAERRAGGRGRHRPEPPGALADPGAAADRPVASLSGGERFRVALARLLFQDPPAQLLILDEPTNNLDTASVDHLAQALDAYRGALIVVSHDDGFLSRLGIDVTLELDRAGGLRSSAGFSPATTPAAPAPRGR